MKFHTVEDLKKSIKPKTYGDFSILDSGVYRIAKEAMMMLKTAITPISLVRRIVLTNPLNSEGLEYYVPQDLDNIVKIKFANNYHRHLSHATRVDIHNDIKSDQYRLSYRNGKKVLELDIDRQPSNTIIHRLDSIDNITGTQVNNLAVEHDNVLDYRGVSFELDTANTNGFVEISGIDKNISDYQHVATNIYLGAPLNETGIDNITSIDFTIGTSSTNQTINITRPVSSDEFEHGWNTILVEPDSSIIDTSNIEYIKIQVNYTTPLADIPIVIDGINATKGEAIEIEYVSENAFWNTTNGFVFEPEAMTDKILLDPNAFNIMIQHAKMILSEEVGAEDAIASIRLAESALEGNAKKDGLHEAYRRKYGTVEKTKQSTHYEPINRNSMSSMRYGRSRFNLKQN